MPCALSFLEAPDLSLLGEKKYAGVSPKPSPCLRQWAPYVGLLILAPFIVRSSFCMHQAAATITGICCSTTGMCSPNLVIQLFVIMQNPYLLVVLMLSLGGPRSLLWILSVLRMARRSSERYFQFLEANQKQLPKTRSSFWSLLWGILKPVEACMTRKRPLGPPNDYTIDRKVRSSQLLYRNPMFVNGWNIAKRCTPVHLYSCTGVLLYTCTSVLFPLALL